MTNGYSGTGISIIFYLVLAIFMPFAYLSRLLLGKQAYSAKFVLRHFLYALMIGLTALVGISYITTWAGLQGTGQWRTVLSYGAWAAVFLILLWVTIPALVRFGLRVNRISGWLNHSLMALWYWRSPGRLQRVDFIGPLSIPGVQATIAEKVLANEPGYKRYVAGRRFAIVAPLALRHTVSDATGAD